MNRTITILAVLAFAAALFFLLAPRSSRRPQALEPTRQMLDQAPRRGVFDI